MTKNPRNRLASVMPLLKKIYAQEDKEAMLKKVANVKQKLRDIGPKSAADLYRKGVAETLISLNLPYEHWRSIRTNNILECLNCRRTLVVGCFLDGESALMFVCTRLRYVVTTEWGAKRILNLKHLYEMKKDNELNRERTERRTNVA